MNFTFHLLDHYIFYEEKIKGLENVKWCFAPKHGKLHGVKEKRIPATAGQTFNTNSRQIANHFIV